MLKTADTRSHVDNIDPMKSQQCISTGHMSKAEMIKELPMPNKTGDIESRLRKAERKCLKSYIKRKNKILINIEVRHVGTHSSARQNI